MTTTKWLRAARNRLRLAILLVALATSLNPGFAQDPPPVEAGPDVPDDPNAATLFVADPPPAGAASSSTEEGRTPLIDAFDLERRRWRIERRRDALRDTQFRFNLRSFYLNRDKYDDSVSEAFTIGGWAGLKTGYFLDHIALGATGYTSQALHAPDDRDGTLLLEPGQEGFTVLGEAYVDIRILDDLHIHAGRKEFDTPFINRNDVRMTPNTFEAIVLQGTAPLGDGGATLKYGAGYFDKIKERNDDGFVSMAQDAGADAERGVFTAGALYQKGNFSFGAIDYYSPDIINIGYLESTLKVPIGVDWEPRFSAQFVDQRSTGDDLLQGEDFSGQQLGFKAELPVGHALFSAGYTHTTDGTNMQSPWSGYPGYTSVQVEDFNRAGEDAILLRAGYEFPWVDGLSAYALWVHGLDPEDDGQYRRDEYDFNVQWGPTKGALEGLSLRVRYAIVQEDGGPGDDLSDFRVICNYGLTF